MNRPLKPRDLDLVPRGKGQGYEPEQVARRRAWVEAKTGASLPHVGAGSIPGPAMRGNIENPVGVSQVPLGVAGPLLVRGEHAAGTFYVPFATTEGALVRSYERGMVAISRAGGATVRIESQENRVCPVFRFADVGRASAFARGLARHLPGLKAAAEATTRHGRLLAVEPFVVGREVIVNFRYSTADAHGMNLIVKATEAACRWLAAEAGGGRYLLFSGMSGEKRASGWLLQGGKGRQVSAGVLLPAAVARAVLHADPADLEATWHRSVVGHLMAGALGHNAHLANGLAAIFIACGQDVANVANSAVGVTDIERTPEGDLHASVTLPSLTVATVGGGTALPTAAECLSMLGCLGAGKVGRFAEIVAAALLAGELSMAAAIASGEFVAAHEAYGRNRPAGPRGEP